MAAGNDNLLISYKNLRRSIGILGISLPIILIVGSSLSESCTEVLDSISMYYHTDMRDVFVGILFAVSLFLYTYKGYDMRDYIVSRAASIFAIGIALCPTSMAPNNLCLNVINDTNPLISQLHFVCAALFFSTLAYNSICLFTESNKSILGKAKQTRNLIYKVCGYVMILCIVLIAVYFFTCSDNCSSLAKINPVFWLETIALWAFGLSWLTKGEMIFGDENNAN
jgi:hypothetical protein